MPAKTISKFPRVLRVLEMFFFFFLIIMCSLVQADNGSQVTNISLGKLKFLEFGDLLISIWIITS